MTGIPHRAILGVTLAICAAALLGWTPPPASVTFTDVAQAAGIDFVHDNAATPEKYLIESMGAGCAWIDYDQDGLLDLYLVNSAATAVYKPKQALRGALYRNNG